jgi:hypothetical protein
MTAWRPTTAASRMRLANPTCRWSLLRFEHQCQSGLFCVDSVCCNSQCNAHYACTAIKKGQARMARAGPSRQDPTQMLSVRSTRPQPANATDSATAREAVSSTPTASRARITPAQWSIRSLHVQRWRHLRRWYSAELRPLCLRRQHAMRHVLHFRQPVCRFELVSNLRWHMPSRPGRGIGLHRCIPVRKRVLRRRVLLRRFVCGRVPSVQSFEEGGGRQRYLRAHCVRIRPRC